MVTIKWVSLVNQDDALFRQLLALNTSIHQLRSQSLQRRARTLSSNRSRSQLSPTLSASLASLTSLTSLSDGEDAEVEGDDSDPDPKNVIIGAGQSVTQRQTISTVVGQAASNNNKPVAPQQQTQLTRKRVSYPPKSRNRSNSQLSRCSFNSSSSSSSSSSTSSSSGGSPTWSLSSADAKAIVKGVKTPRSPHSSFYSRSPTKNPQLSTNNKQRSSANNKHADLLMVFHKRQGSYDSGCQGSEPSDAEVFV
ncbi:hypothetical protein DAPPUDRAFT_99162 [Daphnia pulex]|uniref:Uncharacterized protein n=1 Tax=Daphnia pulex TaxID=6669 RepID=E9G5U7_DAPPU|nr:hypothetical protein DAPPUDRAFT_99162 [Daphnia pulex]|eukprot:EFX84826.1 hypothetical protein DAPPUDRAFT_99162 [Daphnia pulex]